MAANRRKQTWHPQDGTRDLFLSYNSRDREIVVRVQKLLQRHSVKTFLDRENLTPGMSWQSELEKAISQARAVAVFIGREGLGDWQRPEKELALVHQVLEQKAGRCFPVIPVLLPGAKADKVTGFLSLTTWIDLRGGLDNPAAAVALDALARAVKSAPSSEYVHALESLCPYRGLEPFYEDDAPIFFGRDKFADDLLQKVLNYPLVAVVGPSGSGKSSVIQAGLLPRLRRACWPDQTWEAVIFTPREHPFHSLAKNLLPLYETAKSKTDQIIEARKLGAALADREVLLDDPIAAALKAVQTINRLLLVVDQFEELFTLSEERYRQPFIESLISTTTPAESSVTVVLTLRADFYSQAISLSRGLSDCIQQGLVNLGPMTEVELRQVIEEPAKHVGLSFESGLVARLLDDVKGQPGNLPLLEFTLKELWQNRQGITITNEQYDAIGTIEGAISQRADAQFERVPLTEREAVLRAFTRLVRVSAANEEGTDTRQRVRSKDLNTIHPFVKAFVKERLLVMGRDEDTNEETVELAHEALIRRWDSLKELLNKDREFLLWRQRLGIRVSDWMRMGKDDSALLKGVLLDEAVLFSSRWNTDLSEIERGYLERSWALSGRGLKFPEYCCYDPQKHTFVFRFLNESEHDLTRVMITVNLARLPAMGEDDFISRKAYEVSVDTGPNAHVPPGLLFALRSFSNGGRVKRSSKLKNVGNRPTPIELRQTDSLILRVDGISQTTGRPFSAKTEYPFEKIKCGIYQRADLHPELIENVNSTSEQDCFKCVFHKHGCQLDVIQRIKAGNRCEPAEIVQTHRAHL
jgi:hypothetical protein